MRYFDQLVGYRVGNPCPPRDATALDLLLYEINELGNIDFQVDFQSSGLTRAQLQSVSAFDVVWVCPTAIKAQQYNTDAGSRLFAVEDLLGCAIICGNSGEGFLVVKPVGMQKLGIHQGVINQPEPTTSADAHEAHESINCADELSVCGP